MKFETWLFRRMAEILESGVWEIKYKENLKDVFYKSGKRISEDCWGMVDCENDAILIEEMETKIVENEIKRTPGKTIILFHELTHIVFEDDFENFNEGAEEEFVLTIEEIFYKKLTKRQKEYLESFLPKKAARTKNKKTKKSR